VVGGAGAIFAEADTTARSVSYAGRGRASCRAQSTFAKTLRAEANKVELQEERDTDEAQLKADCAKCRDEEEAELRARFDAADQEPGVAKLAVQLAVQDVSEPELDCGEQRAGQHAEAGQEVKEELQRISVEASVAVVMVSADTAAASAATRRQLVGAATPVAAPEKITNSKRTADVAPWITQLKERFNALDMERDARWAAQLKQHPTGLDAKGAARREQTVPLERMDVEKNVEMSHRDYKESRQIETVVDGIDLRSARRERPAQLEWMKEQQAVQSTRDRKLQQEQIQQQSVGVTKLSRLAEISGLEALQQAVQHTTGGLRTGLIFKCGDVEEKPHRQEQQLLLEAEAEKLRGNDSTKEMREQIAQWTAKQQAAQLAKEATKQQALGIASAADLTGQEAQQQAVRHTHKELAAGQVDSLD